MHFITYRLIPTSNPWHLCFIVKLREFIFNNISCVNTVTTTTASSSSGQYDYFLLVCRTYEHSRNVVNMASAVNDFMSVKKMAMIQKIATTVIRVSMKRFVHHY